MLGTGLGGVDPVRARLIWFAWCGHGAVLFGDLSLADVVRSALQKWALYYLQHLSALRKILCPCKLTRGYLFKTFGCSVGVWNTLPQKSALNTGKITRAAYGAKAGRAGSEGSLVMKLLSTQSISYCPAPHSSPRCLEVTGKSVSQPSGKRHRSSVVINSRCRGGRSESWTALQRPWMVLACLYPPRANRAGTVRLNSFITYYSLYKKGSRYWQWHLPPFSLYK